MAARVVKLCELSREEVLFVSTSNRIFAIPMASVKGIFRVPAKAVSQIIKMTEINLKGKRPPLVPLWRKLGLGKDIHLFPGEEKRIILVSSRSGELALLVDRILAQQEVAIKSMEDEEHTLFKGLVTIEKWAFIVDPKAL